MAWMEISEPLLVQLLELPEGTSLGCNPSGNIDLEIHHQDIPQDARKVLPVWVKEGGQTKFLRFDVIDG